MTEASKIFSVLAMGSLVVAAHGGWRFGVESLASGKAVMRNDQRVAQAVPASKDVLEQARAGVKNDNRFYLVENATRGDNASPWAVIGGGDSLNGLKASFADAGLRDLSTISVVSNAAMPHGEDFNLSILTVPSATSLTTAHLEKTGALEQVGFPLGSFSQLLGGGVGFLLFGSIRNLLVSFPKSREKGSPSFNVK